MKKLKEEKLKIEKWRESRTVAASVKNIINDTLAYLALQAYSDDEIIIKRDYVYQHIYVNYPSGNRSVYYS